MGILDMPPGVITSGAIRYEGRDLLTMGEGERRQLRGKELSMVFQDALSALNPVFNVGFQISEALRKNEGMSKALAPGPGGSGRMSPTFRRPASTHVSGEPENPS